MSCKLLILILCGWHFSEFPLTPQAFSEEILSFHSAQQLQLTRRPTAMCWRVDGESIAIANESASSISVVETANKSVSEVNVGGRPVDIAWLKNGKLLAVVDDAASEVKFFELTINRLRLTERLFVGRGARHITVSADESLIAVSSVWDRTVSFIELNGIPEVRSSQRLNYEPGLIRFSADHSILFVVDHFGGHLTALETQTGRVVGHENIAGHQIRGAKLLSNNRLILTHQILNANAPTTAENIAAGAVIENVFQEIQYKLEKEGTILFEPLLINEIGVPSHGAADPASVEIDSDGNRYIALAGVNEVALTNTYGVVRNRIKVGQRPVDLLLDEEANRLYCLNKNDQSISVIDVKSEAVSETISLGPQGKQTSAEHGEILFNSAHRSRFGWYSCHSCHVDGHTNGQLADTFGDDSAYAPKRVLSLLGGRDNNPWAWNGSMRTLHDQVRKSGITTMRGPGFNARETNSVVAYLHTLEPPPPFRPAENVADQKLIETGKSIFHAQGCSNCHIPPLTYTADTMFDVGLTDEHGTRKFNPPSLKAVGYRRGFFHDGRAKQLTDVFVEYGHQLNDTLNENDLQALLRFLESL